MENKKAKIVLIVVLILLFLVCLGVITWQYTKIKNINSKISEGTQNNNIQTPTTDVKQNENNQAQTDIIPDNTINNTIDNVDEENKESESLDPYANHKDIEWSTTSAKSKTGAFIQIKSNNTVYVTYNNSDTGEDETKIVTNIEGKPIKVTAIIGGGVPFFYILTEEGKVYNFEEWDSKAVLAYDLSEYNVIDMTAQAHKGMVYTLAFLTKNGDVIDRKGKLLEK